MSRIVYINFESCSVLKAIVLMKKLHYSRETQRGDFVFYADRLVSEFLLSNHNEYACEEKRLLS